MKSGWYIYDGRRLYFPKAWDTEKEALEERKILLRGYPQDSEWRTRIQVRYFEPKKPLCREVEDIQEQDRKEI